MIPRLRVPIVALVVAVALAGAEKASAALLLPELDSILANDGAHERPVISRSSIPFAPSEAPLSPAEWIEQALVALPYSPLTSTGASTVVTSSPPVSAMLGTMVCVDGPMLVEFLDREGRLLAPIPFLSGVFRPPRTIG